MRRQELTHAIGPCFPRGAFVLLEFYALCVWLVACGPGPSHVKQGPRITSYAHLHDIGIALRDYRDENGLLPTRLSDLVPQYIPTGQVAIFYETNTAVRQQPLPPDWKINPARIDEFSSYTYLATNSARGILAFEKTSIWVPSVSDGSKVAVLFSDFHVQLISSGELLRKLGQLQRADQSEPRK